jgi:hypothetical protein
MKKNKLIPVLTAMMISSCFLVSCNKDNNNKNSEDPHSMNLAKMEKDIDTNTGTYTGNMYAEDEEISDSGSSSVNGSGASTATDGEAPVVNTKQKNPQGNQQLMDNPSAVKNAEQENRKKPATYVNEKEGYIEEPANVQGTVPDTTAARSGKTQIASAAGKGINKNQKTFAVLRGRIDDLLKKEKELKNKISNAANAQTYKPGIKKMGGPAAAAINKEIAMYKAERLKLEQQLASLQKK